MFAKDMKQTEQKGGEKPVCAFDAALSCTPKLTRGMSSA